MDKLKFDAIQSFWQWDTLGGERVLRGRKDPSVAEDDEATYARLLTPDFHNGTISVKVLSRLLPDAPEHARGFIGLVFRANDDNSRFESIYIRPTNGRAEVQLRRNRAVQYFSYPHFKYFHSRATNPGEYESYADMGLDEWIDMRLEVKDSQAKLYLNDVKQPALIVNDLKMGPDARGAVGLFVEVGTDAYFKDFRLTCDD